MKVLTAVHAFTLPLVLCVALVCAQERGFTLQVASVPTEAEARAMTSDLQAKGLESYWSKVAITGKGTRYRVFVGHFTSREAARQQGEQARSQGLIKDFVLVADQGAPKASANAARETKTPTPTPRAVEPKASSQETASGSTEKTELPPSGAAEKTASSSAARERRAAVPQSAASQSQSASLLKTEAKDEAQGKARQASVSLEKQSEPATNPLTITNEKSKWEIARQGSSTDQNLRAVFFVDSLTGWAAGEAGTVYRTTDGGKTWKPLVSDTNININRLHFVDWNTGWMLGETVGKDGAAPQTVLLSTINGGRIWKRQPLPDVVGFYFVSAKTGWAVGYNATLLKTTDGGATWKNYEDLEKLIGLPVESGTYNFGFCDVQFLDEKHGWVIGNFYGRAKNHLGGLFMTSDGGATWKRMPLAVQTQYSSNRLTPGLLHSVQFSDVSHGHVTGEMNDGETRYFFVLSTKDGGATWQQQRKMSHSLHRTQFVSAAQGWTSAVVSRTDKAGDIIYDTSFMKTEDSGATWVTDFTARGNQIRGVFFLSPTKGWAVGERGIILRYDSRHKAN